MARDQEDQTNRLVALLKKRIADSGRSIREIERSAQVGHGTLATLLRGRTELRIRHIALVGQALGFSIADFFHEAYGASGGVDRIVDLVTDALRQELKNLLKTGLPSSPASLLDAVAEAKLKE